MCRVGRIKKYFLYYLDSTNIIVKFIPTKFFQKKSLLKVTFIHYLLREFQNINSLSYTGPYAGINIYFPGLQTNYRIH